MKNSLLILLCFYSFFGFANIDTRFKVLIHNKTHSPINTIVLDTVDNANQRADILIGDQFVDLEIGNSITTFDYVNSMGFSPFDFISGQANFIDFNHNIKLFRNFYLRSGLNLMRFNTTAEDIQNGNFYSWKTTYTGIGTGFNWKFISLGKLQLHLNTKVGYSTLLAGEQQNNRQTFDLANQDDFSGDHWFYKHGFTFYFQLSEKIMLGVNGSILTNAKNAFGPYPEEGIENIKLKSKNIGISLLFSTNE